MSEVVRICSIILLHLSKAMKSQVLPTVWCNSSGEAAGEIWHWSVLKDNSANGYVPPKYGTLTPSLPS